MKSTLTKSGLGLTLAVALAACGNNTPVVHPSALSLKQISLASPSGKTSENPSSWFVELAAPPTAQGFSSQSVLSAQSSFRSLAKTSGIQYREKYTYTTLFSGFSVLASSSEISKISQLAGVKAVYPVRSYAVPKDTTSALVPQDATSNVQVGASVAQNELGLTGQGVKVGIIDSGLDFNHPAFKGRVVAQYDFVGDDYNSDGSSPMFNPVTKPKSSAQNCASDTTKGYHGTHVAGIVAANDATVRGVAPLASLGIYKIFGCEGSTNDDVIIAALERATSDGMQVVNLSLGNFGSYGDGPDSQAVTNAYKKGMVVVVAAGNDGSEGPLGPGYLASAPDAISVASFENTSQVLDYFAAGGRNVGFLAADDGGTLPSSVRLPLARTGTPASTDDACAALPANSLNGQAVLIRRGSCSFYQKALSAQNAGAAFVVLYNRENGLISPSVKGTTPITIPVVFVDKPDGEALDASLQAGPVTLNYAGLVKAFANPKGNLLSDFSSYGPAADLSFKPDIGAPGGQIYSTLPVKSGSYGTLSGTSMAAPHIAGLAALMLQANPSLTPDQIRARLQNTAVPQLYSGAPQLRLLDAIQRQGAGMANVVAAIQSDVVVTPSRLALGASTSNPSGYKATLTLTNRGTSPVTYTLGKVDAVNTTGTFKPVPDIGQTTVTFSGPLVGTQLVTVPAGGTATVDVTIQAPDAQFDQDTLYGGYLTLTSQSKGTLRVPFMGFKGSYQAVNTVNQASLFLSYQGTLYDLPAGVCFSLEGDNTPTIGYNLAYPAQKVIIDVLDSNTYLPIYSSGSVVDSVNSVGRNTGPNSVNTFTWDGSMKAAQLAAGVPVTQTVGNGNYALRARVLKMLGDANNPNDYVTYQTVPFTILKDPTNPLCSL